MLLLIMNINYNENIGKDICSLRMTMQAISYLVIGLICLFCGSSSTIGGGIQSQNKTSEEKNNKYSYLTGLCPIICGIIILIIAGLYYYLKDNETLCALTFMHHFHQHRPTYMFKL